MKLFHVSEGSLKNLLVTITDIISQIALKLASYLMCRQLISPVGRTTDRNIIGDQYSTLPRLSSLT